MRANTNDPDLVLDRQLDIVDACAIVEGTSRIMLAEDAFHAPDGSAGAEGAELAHLPGVGPGLIWMLGQCVVHTLADLAACDRDDLTERLGIVGDIFDVAQWIASARINQESSNNSSV